MNPNETLTPTEQAIQILRRTQDGDLLQPRELALLQTVVNGGLQSLTDEGQAAWNELYAAVISGQYRESHRWLHGIPHLTKGPEGYVRWRDAVVEHYDFTDADRERQAAMHLQTACLLLEHSGQSVNASTVGKAMDLIAYGQGLDTPRWQIIWHHPSHQCLITQEFSPWMQEALEHGHQLREQCASQWQIDDDGPSMHYHLVSSQEDLDACMHDLLKDMAWHGANATNGIGQQIVAFVTSQALPPKDELAERVAQMFIPSACLTQTMETPDAADPLAMLYKPEIRPAMENVFDMLDNRLSKLSLLTRTQREEVLLAHREMHELLSLPAQPRLEQALGTTHNGFTVGHVATMNGNSALSVITGLREADGQLKVVLEFKTPQAVDVGNPSQRFELDWRNISSTYRPDVLARLKHAHDTIQEHWASPLTPEGRAGIRAINHLRTTMTYLQHGLEAAGGGLPKRDPATYELRLLENDHLSCAFHTSAHAKNALDAMDTQTPMRIYLLNTETQERHLGFKSETELLKLGQTPQSFFAARDNASAELNDEQRAAVLAFRDANGRDWKDKLGALWMNGNYSRHGIDSEQAALLQQVRNQFGPEWLSNVSRADLEAKRVEHDTANLRM